MTYYRTSDINNIQEKVCFSQYLVKSCQESRREEWAERFVGVEKKRGRYTRRGRTYLLYPDHLFTQRNPIPLKAALVLRLRHPL